jgi:hypothetical protein
MIPRTIFTVWLSENPIVPELIEKCVKSQQIEGYSHHIITLANYETSSQYVREAIAGKKWVKASDYLRCEYMLNHGGIYLDADMEVLPGKNFDDLLGFRMFTEFEVAGLYANAGFGAEPGHPVIKAYIYRVEANYRGSGDLVFEPGIRTFNDICWAADKSTFTMIGTDVFHPYNHLTGAVNVTPNTKVYHHYLKSWVAEAQKSWTK